MAMQARNRELLKDKKGKLKLVACAKCFTVKAILADIAAVSLGNKPYIPVVYCAACKELVPFIELGIETSPITLPKQLLEQPASEE